MDRKKMLESLSNEKQILLLFLMQNLPQDILKLFTEKGYPICAEALEVLHLRKFSKRFILKCIALGNYKNEDARSLYTWLCGYLEKDSAEDFLLQRCQLSSTLLACISNEALERRECWDELSKRNADDILYKHGFYDMLSPKGLYKYRLFDKYFSQSVAIDPEDNEALDYLAQNEKWDIVGQNYRLFNDNKNFTDFLIKHKQFLILLLYSPEVLLKFSEGIALLQEKKRYHLLVVAGLYDKVNWDEYLSSGTFSSAEDAVEAKQWDALMRNHRHLALLKHFKLWRFVKSFF